MYVPFRDLTHFQKRKAQNRAAQRAFRERKEAHVKGLESRVTELEELTMSKDAENEKLKSQVEVLQAELMNIRGQKFDFDFNMSNVQNPVTDNVPVRNPFQNNGQQNGQQSSPSPSSGSLTDSTVFRSGRSSLATSPENNANKNATPNIDIPFDLFSTSSSGPLTLSNNSNQTSPLFSTDLFNNSPAARSNSASTPLFGQNQNTSPVLDTFAQTLASLTQRNASPLSNNLNVPTLQPPSTSTAPMSVFSPGSTNLFNLDDSWFNTWRDTSAQGGMDDTNFDIFDTMFSSVSPGTSNIVDYTDLTNFIIDSPITNSPTSSTGQPQGITCPEVWEKVKNHPQFDDIDIDQLCAEMRSKAKVCDLFKSRGPLASADGPTDLESPVSFAISSCG
jgi:AP-1-like transcription factor